MRISRDARLALLVLLGTLAALVVSRWEARTHPPKLASARAPERQVAEEGAALRDGRGIDPNRATAHELELVPSVGPALAQRIVAERQAGGPFRNAADLRRVKGIGAKTLAKLEPWLRFESEQVEHTAESQLGLGHGGEPPVLEQEARP